MTERATHIPDMIDRILLVLVLLIPLVLAALYFGVAASQHDDGLYPSWQTPSLVLLVVVPYVLVAYGLLLRDERVASGLSLVVGGFASLVPAFFTLTVLIGLGLAVLAVALVVRGVTCWRSVRRIPSMAPLLLMVVAVTLLLASPDARFAHADERCVRTLRNSQGVETHEVFTSAHTASGQTRLGGTPNSVRETCTSDYTTATEAGMSSALSLAGAAFALLAARLSVRAASPRDRVPD